MSTDRVTITDKPDPIAIQARIAEETAKSNALQQAEKQADLYHTELALEEQLARDTDGPTNIQRLAALMARNLII